jgi:hypothetical protein
MMMWKEHGTKIVGSVITILGVVGTLGPDSMIEIFGERGPGIAGIIAGVVVVLRGVQNTFLKDQS